MNSTLLKRAMLLFWSAWFAVVFLTNLADSFKAAGLLADSWQFASGNFQFMCETTSRYGVPIWLNGVMFAGVIVWEGIATVLFFWAARSMAKRTIFAAFTASLGLFGGFMLADEILIAYSVEGTHLRLFVAHLVTLLAVELLPS